MRQKTDEPVVIEKARRRLANALDLLEAAVNRRRESDRQRAELEAQIQAFGADRSRVAAPGAPPPKSPWERIDNPAGFDARTN